MLLLFEAGPAIIQVFQKIHQTPPCPNQNQLFTPKFFLFSAYTRNVRADRLNLIFLPISLLKCCFLCFSSPALSKSWVLHSKKVVVSKLSLNITICIHPTSILRCHTQNCLYFYQASPQHRSMCLPNVGHSWNFTPLSYEIFLVLTCCGERIRSEGKGLGYAVVWL